MHDSCETPESNAPPGQKYFWIFNAQTCFFDRWSLVASSFEFHRHKVSYSIETWVNSYKLGKSLIAACVGAAL